ncbi:MAG: class I SAM-dependent methyltransferase [Candidatus Heimdallarchaeaceae archaeon]|jgi:tRNA (guanine37-N1)-methyltransferase
MKDLASEIIGNILIIREIADKNTLKKFAKEKMNKHPYINTVVVQTSKVHGQERRRNLKHLMGENTFVTIYKEHGNSFYVDLEKAFFSPRLSFERQRIVNLVKKNEKILNFFAGVGPFGISIASKQSYCEIHSIEINEFAYQYLCKNIELNNCQDRVFPHLGDAFEIVPEKFLNQVNRILLPLPMEADRALPLAFNSLKQGKGYIHWQLTEKIILEDTIKDTVESRLDRITPEEISHRASINSIRIIRWLAPRIAHIAVDLHFS